MTRKIFIVTLSFMLVMMPALSHAEKKAHLVQRDWKTNKIKRMVSNLYDKRKANEAKNYLVSCGPEALKYVAPLMNDENNESVRIAALYIIGKVGGNSYEDAVKEKLQDKSPRVRKVAARTLKKMGIKGVVAPESFHSKDEWKFVKRSWKTNKIKRTIVDLYDKNRSIEAKKYLANYGPEVLEFVVPLVNDKNNENVRVDALY
ncbi:MAG: HEAT repeat domain-containing protein, partial [Candidatus Omnitrophota bacterium]